MNGVRRKVSFEIKAEHKIFSDPQYGLRNLIGCLFNRINQIHLLDDAVFLLNFIKKNGGLPANAYKRYIKDKHKSGSAKSLEIEGRIFTWSNFETILQNLRSAGLLDKRQGVYKLSRNFSRYLNTAAETWNSFFES
jgi:hypothetical protein